MRAFGFTPDQDFAGYEDFRAHLSVRVPDHFNFAFDVVDAIAADDPERLALVWCDEKGREARFTFSELKRFTDSTAHFFKALGIGEGDRVMLMLKRRYEFWFCLLALHKLRAIAIPATHLLTTKDIVYRNNAARVKMVIAVADDNTLRHVVESEADSPSLKVKVIVAGEKPGWISFDEGLRDVPDSFERPLGQECASNGDVSLLYFTSGTTGMPKMVAHDFTYPLGHLATARFWQNVQEGGLHLSVADTGWAKAAWGKIYGQWLCGSAVFVYDFDEFKAKELLEVMARYRVTTFCAPPTIYRFLIKEDLSRYDLRSLIHCVVAGEPLNPEVYEKFLEMTGLELREGYGQTESTLAIGTFRFMKPRPGSMGRPTPGYDVDVLDENGTPCETGKPGQIVIRTGRGKPLGMFGGYYEDEQLTGSVWRDGVYYTGDLAYLDEDGYYWFVGRADDVIKSSGYRIGPFEVESALVSHPAVIECAVTGAPDPDRGQVVKATVVLAKGFGPSERLVRELQDHVKRVTAPYKYPRIIEFVKELPKTLSGKIRRAEIRKRDKEHYLHGGRG